MFNILIMNKLFFRLSLLFLIAGLGFVSCSKEEINDIEESQSNVTLDDLQSKKQVDYFTYSNNVNWEKVDVSKSDFESDYKNNEERKIDNLSYEIAMVLKETLLDKRINQQIIQLAKRNKKGFISLTELCEINSRFLKLFEAKRIFLDNLDLQYSGTAYVPVINIINLDLANSSYNPIICAGIEIDGMDDAIIGWSLDKKLKMNQIAVTEKMAINSNSPVFVVCPHPKNELDVIPTLIPEKIRNFGSRSSEGLSMTHHQVKKGYPFERSRKLEYRVGFFTSNLTYTDLSGTNSFILSDNNITKKDVKKSKLFTNVESIGSYAMNSFTFGGPTGAPRDFYLLTWERDWYTSPKTVSCSCNGNAGQKTYSVFPRMKFSNEFWNKRCGKGQVFQSVGNALNDDIYKGRIRIRRSS